MKVNIEEITVGADPELFLRATTSGKPWVSAHGLIPGTKEEPHKIDHGAVQVDGMAVEYNIDPAKTVEEFIENNNKVLIGLSKMIPDYEIVNRPLVTFSDKVWDGVPEEAKELGCDPDLNAYTGEENPRPDGDKKFRTAAGHVHIGWTEGMDTKDIGHTQACTILAQELDYFLGVPSLWLDNSADSIKRRTMYGQAGAHRVKPYGMEYRVLSNFWVGNPVLMEWVFNNVKVAFKNLLDGKTLTSGSFDARRMINGGKSFIDDVPYLCESYSIPLPKTE